jgi:carboxylesterase
MNAADGLGLLQQPDLQQLCVTPHEFVMPGEGRNARTGVLLIHGLTGTPAEMRLLAKGLNKQGFTVYGVQLAGHCGSMEDLVAARWTDWLASVESGLQRFSLHVDHVVVGGLSMGALLSLAVAERHPDKVAGVCALSTTFRYDGWSIPAYTKLAFLLPLFRLLGIGRNSVFMEAPPYGIKDEALRARVVEQMNSGDSSAAGLPGNPWWSVIELRALSANVQAGLAQLRSPCLVIHAREDDISSVSNAHDIQRGAVNAHVDLVLLDNCYHMITIDRERRTVIAKLNEFIARIASSAAPARVRMGSDLAPGGDAVDTQCAGGQRGTAGFQGRGQRAGASQWHGALALHAGQALAVGGHCLLCGGVSGLAGVSVAGAAVGRGAAGLDQHRRHHDSGPGAVSRKARAHARGRHRAGVHRRGHRWIALRAVGYEAFLHCRLSGTHGL